MKRFSSLLLICLFATQIVAQPRPLPRQSGSVRSDESAERIGRAIAQGMSIERDGYPNLQLCAGYSFVIGPNVSLKAELGKAGGFSIDAGIGKKFRADIMTRYMGLGFYAGKESESISFGVKFGQVIENLFVDIYEPGIENLFFYCYLDYTHFFEKIPRIGYYIGAGFECEGPDTYDESFFFEFHFGIAYKILVK